MERRFRNGLMGALFALCTMGGAMAVCAQDAPPNIPGPPLGGPEGPLPPGQGPGFSGPPGFGPGPGMFGNPMPELAKKMTTLMALREMLGMRLTAKDISTALPSLRELRDAEKSLKTQAEQALDEDKKALLAAQSENDAPPDSGEKIRRLMERYREKQEDTWQSLAKSLGGEKAGGLRQLIGQGGGPGPFRGGPAGGPPLPGADNVPGFAPTPPPPNQDRIRPDGGPERQAPPGQPGTTPRGRPGFGQGQPGQPFPGRPQGRGMTMPFMQPRLTLPELVDLLEQRLAAMKK